MAELFLAGGSGRKKKRCFPSLSVSENESPVSVKGNPGRKNIFSMLKTFLVLIRRTKAKNLPLNCS